MIETKMIEIVLNGEPKRIPDGLSVLDLLAHLGIDSSRVAIELNREIVHKGNWAATLVGGGSQVEVVWFVGGGS